MNTKLTETMRLITNLTRTGRDDQRFTLAGCDAYTGVIASPHTEGGAESNHGNYLTSAVENNLGLICNFTNLINAEHAARMQWKQFEGGRHSLVGAQISKSEWHDYAGYLQFSGQLSIYVIEKLLIKLVLVF